MATSEREALGLASGSSFGAEDLEGLTTSDLEELRALALDSLYFLCVGILGYRDVNPRFHGRFCLHIQEEQRRRRLGLMPRGHLKSTIATVGDSIRLALRDPDDCRILVVAETATLSEKFLSEIKSPFLTNKLLRGLFPEIIPERFVGPGVVWRNDQATVRRSTGWKEATWQAIGVGGASVGSHFTRIKADDLIGFEAIRSPAEMAKAKSWVDNIEALLVSPSQDIIDFIGTRWSRNDLYQHIMDGYGEELGVFTQGPVVDGEIFEAKYSWAVYNRIQQINPAQWAAQYENNPLTSNNVDFPVGMLRDFRFSPDEQRIILSPQKSWEVGELDRVLTVDPNSGSLLAPDCAAISVQGYSPDGEVIVLESWSARVSPSDLVDKTYQLARKWRPRVAGFEKAGQQNTDHYFKIKAEQENYFIRVAELRPRGRQKEERVRAALQPIIRSGLLYLLPSQTVLRHQLSEFPDTVLWDEVDALSYGPELWQKPEKSEVTRRREGIVKRLLARRHPVTGY